MRKVLYEQTFNRAELIKAGTFSQCSSIADTKQSHRKIHDEYQGSGLDMGTPIQ